ncbi:hypothetical protein D3C85_1040680 [compost metagenome]
MIRIQAVVVTATEDQYGSAVAIARQQRADRGRPCLPQLTEPRTATGIAGQRRTTKSPQQAGISSWVSHIQPVNHAPTTAHGREDISQADDIILVITDHMARRTVEEVILGLGSGVSLIGKIHNRIVVIKPFDLAIVLRRDQRPAFRAGIGPNRAI